MRSFEESSLVRPEGFLIFRSFVACSHGRFTAVHRKNVRLSSSLSCSITSGDALKDMLLSAFTPNTHFVRSDGTLLLMKVLPGLSSHHFCKRFHYDFALVQLRRPFSDIDHALL